MLLPLALMVAVSSPISGRLVAAYGAAPPLMISGVIMAAGGFLLTFLKADTSLWYLGLAFGVYGIGFGIVNAPLTNAAVSGLPKDQAGTAAAVTSTSRQVGNSLGAAVFGSILAARLSGTGGSGTDDFAHGTQPLWWIITVIGLVILISGWSVRKFRPV